MEAVELATILHQMYNNADRNEATCQIHLFGIIYASELQSCGHPLRHIVKLSGISMGYLPEISKGIKLSKYVQLKENSQ
jgi:hypothetical protein